MAEINNPEIRKEWLRYLSDQMIRAFYNGAEFDNYAQYAYHIQNFLWRYKLPQVEGGEYISVQKGIARSMADYINSAKDQQHASGAVLWAILNKVHPKDGKGGVVFPKTPEGYRKYRRVQRKVMQFLGDLNLDLGTKDKINALDLLGYKYSAEEYRAVYKQLGNYNFGKNSTDLEYEKKQTVKIFHELHNECKKSTRKDKVVSAQAFLETVARNADVLETASYNDLTIDEQSKADIYKIIKNIKGEFSEDALAYYSGNSRQIENIGEYIGEILSNYQHADSPMSRRDIISRDFLRVTAQLSKQDKINMKTIDKYSSYLSLYAYWYPNNSSLNAALLEELLEKEARDNNESVKEQSLFPDYVSPKELRTINKPLVLKVAKNYADSFSCSHSECEEFNFGFYKSMTEMFINITTKHNYRKSEVKALCEVLSSNGDEATKKMSQQIMYSYTSNSKNRKGPDNTR